MMDSPDQAYLRVVVARRGKVRAAEFRLRGGEVGLSLFRRSPTAGPEAILKRFDPLENRENWQSPRLTSLWYGSWSCGS
jgi:hypothetical protein